MTRLLLLTSGTRGDVQPFIALGRGLQRRGLDVRLCTHARFRGFVESHGLEYANMDDGLLELADTREGRALTEGKGNVLAATRAMQPVFARTLRDAQRAAEGCDLIIYHPKAMAGPSLAEAHGVPGVLSLPAPGLTPTRAFALPLATSRDLGRRLNLWSYSPLRLANLAFYGELKRWRASLGLPAPSRFAPAHLDPSGRPVPTLYPVSPRVVPRPADWPETTHLTGYWFLDEDPPTSELADFVAVGEPPVVVSFSSMVGQDAAARTHAVVTAIKQAKVRAVLVGGWGGLETPDVSDNKPGEVFVTPSAPFGWLFSQAAAVVHHGGAGTTAEALRAGVPSLICPFFGDQPFWGARVHELGVGPRPIPQKRLTADRLTDALREMIMDRDMRQQAKLVGEHIGIEDGIEATWNVLKNIGIIDKS